ncbi:MAG: DUF3073 domain-containing protein [Marmoricola sp.]|nr:DUF3073 domain-containing protein [Marmoricola sp.]
MGRGRAKAKQTKVARDLKYRTHETDFGALAKELHGDEADDSDQESDKPDPDDEFADYDKWSDYSESRSD